MSELATQKRCPQCDHEQDSGTQSFVFCVKCRFPLLLIAGHYRCTKEIGEGGFGTVYLAESDRRPTAPCVIKVLKPETLQITGMDKRFQREIRLTEQLSEHNEHIVKMIDYGEEPGLGHYYVMEHLEGKELFARLRGRTPLSYKEIFHIFRQLCEGMAIAHRTGVIHRDLKPNNVFLVEKGDDPLFVKIIDFGIAKPLEGTANPDLTKGMLGTPHYMPPEQCANQTIDQRSDIYAMGAILFEMLTNRPPFSGELSDILLQKMTKGPPSIREMQPDRDFPEGIDVAILRAMAKEPADRFRSAAAFWKALAPHIESFEEDLMLDGRTIDWDELDDASLAMDDTGALGNISDHGYDTEFDAATMSASEDALERALAVGEEEAFAATMATPLPIQEDAPLMTMPGQMVLDESKVILSDSIVSETSFSGEPSPLDAEAPVTPPKRGLDPAVYVAICVGVLLVGAVLVLVFK